MSKNIIQLFSTTTTTIVEDRRSPLRFVSSEIMICRRLSLIQENHDGTLIHEGGEEKDAAQQGKISSPVPTNSGPSSPVYNPVPLRWFDGPDFPYYEIDWSRIVDKGSVLRNHDELDLTLGLPVASTPRNPNPNVPEASDSVVADSPTGGAGEKKKRPIKRRRKDENEENRLPLIPIEGIPLLKQTLESRGGTRPVFLYMKKLEKSDVIKDQNRLLLTRTERVMEFLTEEEVAAVMTGKGLKAVGVDAGGRVYERVGLTKWGKVTVMNADWWRIVEASGTERGDVVEIWGCRENGKLWFAFNFRKE